ncbi:MAG TPA: putative Ig domain-containing protein [Terracidiphilus sp.]|nr:putative Ig domain-containing protein [Terracidiphilus sp.]
MAGSATFGVQVKDSAGNTATASLTVTIGTGLTITSANPLPVGYVGTAYSDTLTAAGGSGSGRTWSVTAGSSELTAVGLSLSSAGVLSGTTPVVGTATFTAKVVDSANNSATATLSVTINPGLTITSSSPLPAGTAGVAYSYALTTSGGTGTGLTWSVSAGSSSLTAVGLSLSSGGVLSGATPIAGTASFTVQVKDSANNVATGTFSVTVYSGVTLPAANPATLGAADAGLAYTGTIVVAGGSGNYTWTVTGLSDNLTSSTSGSTLTITGTPTASTSTTTVHFNVTVKDTTANQTAGPVTYSITVYPSLSLPAPDPSSLPSSAYVGIAYNNGSGGTITGAGGSGTLSIVSPLPNSPGGPGLPVASGLSSTSSGATLTVSGTPTAYTTPPYTLTFNVTLTDTTTGYSITQTGYYINVSNPPALSLPTPSSTVPGSATVGASYTGSITASGGVAPYTWSINGTNVPAGGTSLGDSLTATASGDSLNIAGTPGTAETVSLTNVEVKDSLGTSATNSYSILVSNGSQVSGQITLYGVCGSISTLPKFTVSINTSPVQTTTTDSNGNYSFASVPNGTFTITPSITGASSVFYPATITGVTVTGNSIASEDFEAEVGYTVTGTIQYSPATESGPIYINLQNNNCGGSGGPGTTISAPGSFTIQGVAPGTYTLSAWMDTIGQGFQNANDPSGTSGTFVTVSNANSGSNIDTLVNPTTPTLSTNPGPTLGVVSPTNDGVVISYGPVTTATGGNGLEEATSYTVEWSTSSSFPSGSTGSKTFIANGTNTNAWILNNTSTGSSSSFANGTSYYFRAQGTDGTTNVTPWVVLGGSSPTAVKIGANTTGSTVTGSVTIPSGVTIAAGAPLYVGLYSQGSNGATVYADEITSPVVGANNFTVTLPNGTYYLFAILDQNNDGLIDVGDVTNVRGNSNTLVTVSGNMGGQDITLSAADSTATVQTQYQTFTNNGSTTGGYQLNFQLREGDKLPVAVELESGPNLALPVNVGNYCQGCSVQFDYNVQLPPGLVPTTSQSYTLNVTYGDNTTGTVTAPITGVLGASQLATLISPVYGSSTTAPSFDWSYPANASDYIYEFQLCCSSNNDIWQIPNQNSSANGFTSSQVTPPLTWGVDPTDSSNAPSVSALTENTQYNWQVTTMDSNGNSATASANFVAEPSSLTITTPDPMPNGVTGTAYSQTLTATGGDSPYIWSITAGTLPAGLSLTASTGVISGMPITAGTSNFTVLATDSENNTATANLSITINAGTLVVTTTALPFGVVNTAYSQGLAASGGTPPYTWSIISGSLPGGLSLTASSGLVSGTPTASGTSSFEVKVSDSASHTATGNVSLNILSTALTVTNTTLTNGTENVAYSATLTATGGVSPYTWSISSGSLPSGLSLNASSGLISGTPLATGTSTFTVKVTDSDNDIAIQLLSITITSSQLTVGTEGISDGTVGIAYSQTLVASGGTPPYTWSVSVGSLPAGLSLDASTGVISGKPTSAGSTVFEVQVADSASHTATSGSLSIRIYSGLEITTKSLASGQTSVSYSAGLSATSGTSPYTWALASGTLPAGLSLSSGGAITGTPTCTCATPSTSVFQVSVQDSESTPATVTATLSITINNANLPRIETLTLDTGTVGTAYEFQMEETGGATPVTWSVISGSLPAGLTLASNGTIGGTPTTAGDYDFIVQLEDANSNTTARPEEIEIYPAALQIDNPDLQYANVGKTYATKLDASGGSGNYVSWTITSGSLPSGLTLSSTIGEIEGTAAAAGSSTFTVQVEDSASNTATATFTLTVYNNPACPSGNESELNGTYAMLLSGFVGDGLGTPVATLASFTANGAGGIAGGELDNNTGSTGSSGSTEIAIAPGSYYSVGSSGAGCITINTANGTNTYAFVLGGVTSGVATRGRIMEFDDETGYGQLQTGALALQTSADFDFSKLASHFAFGISGDDSSVGRFAFGGSLTNSSAGSFSDVYGDSNDNGTVNSAMSGGSGGFGSAPDANGRTTASISIGGNTYNYIAYIVNADEVFLLSSDPIATNPVASGTMLVTASSFTNSSVTGNYILAAEGADASNSGYSFATMGILNFSGGDWNGTIYQYELDGPGSSQGAPQSPSGTYTVDAASGRVALTLSSSGTPPAIYLTSSSSGPAAFVIDLDSGSGAPAYEGTLLVQPNETYNNTTVSGNLEISLASMPSNEDETVIGPGSVGDGEATFTLDAGIVGAPQEGGITEHSAYTINANGTGTSVYGTKSLLLTNGSTVYLLEVSGGPAEIIEFDAQ